MKRRLMLELSAGEQKARFSRGFTLLEMTLVLGVVGLIIGAIFAAGSLGTHRVNVNQGSDEVNLIAGNMRALYSGQNPSFVSLNAIRPITAVPSNADFCFYTGTGVTQGIFPNEMILPRPVTGALPAAGSQANNPWSMVTIACAAGADGSAEVALAKNPATNSVQLVVRYTNVPREVCPDIVVRNSLPATSSGVMRMYVNGVLAGDVPTNTLPISNINAAAQCNAVTNTIDWYYNLTG